MSKPREKKRCKFCRKNGTYSFGWLDSNGEWQDKHLTCAIHAPISMSNQDLKLKMEQMRERFKFRPTQHLFIGSNNP